MANVLVEQQNLVDVGNAIRNVNGTDNKYKPSEMAQAIIDTKDKSLIEMLESKTNLQYALAYTDVAELPVFNINSACTLVGNLFVYSKIVTAPALDYSNIKNAVGMFANCELLVTIPTMNIKSLTSSATTTFTKCYSLQNISFEKNCIEQSISFTQSPLLSNESIQSIIDGLAVITSSRVLTFHSEVTAKLTDEQISQITEKGWKYQ